MVWSKYRSIHTTRSRTVEHKSFTKQYVEKGVWASWMVDSTGMGIERIWRRISSPATLIAFSSTKLSLLRPTMLVRFESYGLGGKGLSEIPVTRFAIAKGGQQAIELR